MLRAVGVAAVGTDRVAALAGGQATLGIRHVAEALSAKFCLAGCQGLLHAGRWGVKSMSFALRLFEYVVGWWSWCYSSVR